MTEQTKHTRGPWKQSDRRNIGWTLIEPEEGGAVICKILTRHPTGQREKGDFQEEGANAKLIAAAPDLLEALKTCRDALRDHVQYDNGESLERDGFVAATTAIGKAEGEA